MFENEKQLSEKLRKEMETFLSAFAILGKEIKKSFTEILLDLIKKSYDEGMDDGLEDDSRCDDCDERRGEPMINEGYC